MASTKIRASAQQINELLVEEYGHREWQPHRDPMSELVLTILSQHTSDTNSGRAFAKLVARFSSWDEVREAPVEEIAEAVSSAGLGRIKAARIKGILQEILARRGELDIYFLAGLPLDEAKAWLRSLPGVGPKTAACVLLFSLQRPALPVDTHVHRIVRRLGLVDAKASAEQAQDELEDLVPPEAVYDFHVNLIAHGRQVCKAQRPRCEQCVLAQVCPSSEVG